MGKDWLEYLILTIVLFIFASWNAFVILWKQEKNAELRKKFSKIWHSLGLWERIFIWIYYPTIYLYNNGFVDIDWHMLISHSAMFVLAGGLMYDFIINAWRFYYKGKPDLWYVDNKGWNKFFLNFMKSKTYWIFRLVLAIISVAVVIVL